MNISIVGTGYVGLVTGAGFAEKGHNVACVDLDKEKVGLINSKKAPIYEEGLDEILSVVVGRNLKATTDLREAVLSSQVTFICVGTPSDDGGKVDLSYVRKVSEDLGRILTVKKTHHVVVVKSTVIPGSTEETLIPLIEKHSGKKAGKDFGVAMNPEFLREGVAIQDFMNPDRIVIGSIDQKSGDIVESIYFDFKAPVLRTNLKTAEMIKYTANSFLATKISFINEVGNMCKEMGIDVYDVAKGIGMDRRISPHFLSAGPGFGGSCFAGDESTFTLNSPHLMVNSFKDLFDQSGSATQIVEPSNNYTLSFDTKESRPVFSGVKCITKRRFNGNFIELKTSMGRVLKVTWDHPLVVYDRKDFMVKLAEDVEVNDELPIPLGMPPLKKMREINLMNHVSYAEFVEKLKVRPAGDYFRANYGKFKHYIPAANKYDFRRKNYLPYAVYKKLRQGKRLRGLDEKRLFLFTTKGSPTYIPAVFKVDDKFMRLLGYYVSEGYISVDLGRNGVERERVGLSFDTHEKEYISDVKNILDSWGIKYITRKGGGSHSIVVSSKILAFLLRDVLGCGVNSYDKRLPRISFNVSNQLKMSLLHGLFSGDGSITTLNKGRHFMFEYATVNKALADGIIMLLQSLNIVPTLKARFMNKSKTQAYIIRVNGVRQLKKLKTVFGVEKERTIEELISRYRKMISLSGVRIYDGFGTVKVIRKKRYEDEEDVYSMETENGLLVGSSGLIVHNCFPKDVQALVHKAKTVGVKPTLLESVLEVNKQQPKRVIELVKKKYSPLEKKRIAVLGLAFKAGTDDMRESPSIPIVKALTEEGAQVFAYDPQASENARKIFRDSIKYASSVKEALKDASLALILTEWGEFKNIDYAPMKEKKVFDARKIVNKDLLPKDVEYEGLCW